MSHPLVVTPTLGQSAWLNETVASVARLPMVCQHVLVCPSDVRGELEKRFPQLQVLTGPEGGMYAAINAGIGAAGGGHDAFTYLNDDDVLSADGAALALKTLGQEARIDVVYGRVRLISARGAPEGWLPVAHQPGDLASLLTRGVVPLAQPGTWLRPALVKRLGGFDESFRLAGDLDLFSRAMASGARFGYVPAEVASFRLHAGQLSKGEATGDEEKRRLLARWNDNPTPWSAVWRFRRDNLPVYLDRIRRHGLVSMRQLYRSR